MAIATADLARMKDVAAWLLSSRDYKSGVRLYEKYGSSKVLLAVLQRGETSFNRNKLIQALQELKAESEPVDEPAVPEKEIGIYTGSDYEDQPQDIKDRIAAAKAIYKQIGAMHATIRTHVGIAERKTTPADEQTYLKEHKVGDLINQMLDLDDEREALLYIIDYWKREKRMPEVPDALEADILVMTEGQIRSELLKLRPNISKCKHRPHRAADVASWTARVHKLERRLMEL